MFCPLCRTTVAKGLTCQRSQPKLCGGEELPIGANVAAARATSAIDWIHGATRGKSDGRLSRRREEIRRRGRCRRGRQDREASGHCAAAIANSSLVSCTDQKELDRVKASWVAKKLGVADGAKADAAIEKICKAMAADNTKSRVTFYYLVAKDLGKLASL